MTINFKTFVYKPNEFYVIQLESKIEPKQYRLEYNFTGKLSSGRLVGLYRSKYVNSNNKSIGLASTQFAFTDARKAFPCFDEPSFKSIFELTIIHDKHMNTTLSNMDIASEVTDTALDWVTTKYKKSLPMSSYLVGIVVSDFVCKYTTNEDDIKIGVCAQPVLSYKLDYGLMKTEQNLHYMEKIYTGIAYPLPKLDMLAIPTFKYWGMENWGLVTFRETLLLWHPDNDTSAYKIYVNANIAHELNHFVIKFCCILIVY